MEFFRIGSYIQTSPDPEDTQNEISFGCETDKSKKHVLSIVRLLIKTAIEKDFNLEQIIKHLQNYDE